MKERKKEKKKERSSNLALLIGKKIDIQKWEFFRSWFWPILLMDNKNIFPQPIPRCALSNIFLVIGIETNFSYRFSRKRTDAFVTIFEISDYIL